MPSVLLDHFSENPPSPVIWTWKALNPFPASGTPADLRLPTIVYWWKQHVLLQRTQTWEQMRPGLGLGFCPSLALQLLTGYLDSLSFRFHIWKMGAFLPA